jgi:hypothetical protein
MAQFSKTPYEEWQVGVESGANAAITTSKAAVVGQTHYVTCIVASYSQAVTGKRVTVRDLGSGQIRRRMFVPNTGVIPMDFPIKCGDSEGVEILLEAGGASVIGIVSIGGFTRPNGV